MLYFYISLKSTIVTIFEMQKKNQIFSKLTQINQNENDIFVIKTKN